MFPANGDEFDQLPASERLRLVLELWERLARRPEDVPIPDSHLAELEDRLDEDDRDPDGGIPLEVARQRLRSA